MKNLTHVGALAQAVDSAGGQSALAATLTERRGEEISSSRVWNWVNRDKRAPAEFCPDIESITGITCEALRPDVNWAVLRGRPVKRSNKKVA